VNVMKPCGGTEL